MNINLAQRAHNENNRFDPIIRSLLDTDFYKLLMAQFIFRYFPDVQVRFSLINRTRKIKLGECVPSGLLRLQLDHVRSLRFGKTELIWLRGNTFYGKAGIFAPDFIDFLAGYSLPDYVLEEKDGQWELCFEGGWLDETLWELYALSITSELRTRHGLAKLNGFELDILYARAKAKLWSKIERFRGVPGLKIADFGTRRRHSFLWHEYVVMAMKAELPDIFTGTSNAYLAFKHDMEAIGTNAHELPMTLAALARQGKLGKTSLRESQYTVVHLWREMYDGNLQILLPDTFGTTQFLDGAPDWVADASGARLDSKDPFEAGEEMLSWWASRGRDPVSKLLIPSDGLDVDPILALHAQFGGKVGKGVYFMSSFRNASDFTDPLKWTHEPRCRIAMGFGSGLTIDFIGCHPRGGADFDQISLVCKVTSVNGHPAVKLSDNYNKATGDVAEIDHYRSEFGVKGVGGAPVVR
jgi:nicotinate phosphoribosyltransferase